MGVLKINQQSGIEDFFEKPQDRKTLDAFALPGQAGKYPVRSRNLRFQARCADRSFAK